MEFDSEGYHLDLLVQWISVDRCVKPKKKTAKELENMDFWKGSLTHTGLFTYSSGRWLSLLFKFLASYCS
jgi:hypothetical protein